MTKVILITGASSGIGFDAAASLARQGHRVYAAARRVERMEPLKALGVVPLRMDVTDEASMEAGVRTVLEAEGRIDVLVNNAGYGYFGAIENVPMEEARRQQEVNVFGLARLCQLVLPSMREHRLRRGKDRPVFRRVVPRVQVFRGGAERRPADGIEAFRHRCVDDRTGRHPDRLGHHRRRPSG